MRTHRLAYRTGVLLGLASYCMSIVNGCVEPISGIQLQYEEKIVISGILIAGDTLKNINIMRTQPPLEKIDYQKSALPDAKVHMIVDNQTYPMYVQKPPLTRPDISVGGQHPEAISLFTAPNLIVQSGKRYEIRVEWRGKRASATTLVPFPATVDSVFTFSTVIPAMPPRWPSSETITLGAMFQTRPDEVYYMIGKITGQETIFTSASDFIYTWKSNVIQGQSDAQARLSVKISASLRSPVVKERWIYVFALDKPYFDYISTQDRSKPPTEEYFSGGANTIWNVTGDGIGLFVGAAVTILPVPKN